MGGPHPLLLAYLAAASVDPDVWLNRQVAFTTVDERAAYAYSLDYRQPVLPPLGEADAAWARQGVQATFPSGG